MHFCAHLYNLENKRDWFALNRFLIKSEFCKFCRVKLNMKVLYFKLYLISCYVSDFYIIMLHLTAYCNTQLWYYNQINSYLLKLMYVSCKCNGVRSDWKLKGLETVSDPVLFTNRWTLWPYNEWKIRIYVLNRPVSNFLFVVWPACASICKESTHKVSLGKISVLGCTFVKSCKLTLTQTLTSIVIYVMKLHA